ncbi:MAG: ATP-binding protein, partial [Syntrophaceae bacterium]
MADPNPPSRGERNAIIGYKPQYEIAAIKIIQAIRLGNLESIRIADPEAGRVDDFQILTPNRIDAFQVKWSEHSSLVTYNALISTDSKGKPNLLFQLADGWKRIRISNPGKRVVVHLVMRDHPSPNTTRAIPFGDKIPAQYHFAGFISHVWNKVHASIPGEVYQIPLEWGPAWDRFRESSGLTTIDEFNDFVKDCELEFGYEIPTFEELPTNDRNLLIEEKNYISSKLIEIVADSGSPIEYTLKEFLEYLGWSERNRLVNIHDFPVNERTYQQIEGLNEEFERLISATNKGYVSIIGTPGSGKSTFLTQTLKNRNERVIKYYSFVPDSFEPVNLRGEAKNFLHDITFQLDRMGFSSGGSISSYDRNILQKRFHNQLQLLHTAWEKDHRKTIFLIDGLDHIAREQHPEFSLLNDLPNPTAIPDGIIFVLGSQTDEIFPSAIKSEVRNGRRIEMRPLSRQAVLEIINATNFKTAPTSDQISRIFTLSDGHPLALNYILNRIYNAQSTEDINTILSSTQQYSGNIEQQYQSYWDAVSVDSLLFELFGLIARCKSGIDISWFEGWHSQKAIFDLKKNFSHYFKRHDQHSWSFFHNSFRIFVLQKTCDSGQGVIDPLKSIHYHKILTDQSIRQPDNLIHTWDEFFHRYNAKQYQEIIDLATPEYFRNQFLNYRSIPDIKNDINIALGCAKELQNFIIL